LNALKEFREFVENSTHLIFFTFQERVTISSKMIFDYENGDESPANQENCFRIKYFDAVVNKIKLNLQTRFETFVEFVNTYSFVFEVSNLKQMSEGELRKHC
jgi:hypothetical protein